MHWMMYAQGYLRSLVQKQRRNGHTAPATRRQSRRLLKQHHDAGCKQACTMHSRCMLRSVRIITHSAWFSDAPTEPCILASPLESPYQMQQVADGDQCAVCLETFAIDETVSQLGCSHCFHIDCLDPLITTNWQSNNFRCPLCRRPFLERP